MCAVWEESTPNPNGPAVRHTPCCMATDPLEFPWLIICHGLSFARLEFHSLHMQNIRQDVWCFCSSGLPVCRVDQSAQCRCYTVHTQLCVRRGCTWTAGARPQCGSVCKWMVLSMCSHIPPGANADYHPYSYSVQTQTTQPTQVFRAYRSTLFRYDAQRSVTRFHLQ